MKIQLIGYLYDTNNEPKASQWQGSEEEWNKEAIFVDSGLYLIRTKDGVLHVRTGPNTIKK